MSIRANEKFFEKEQEKPSLFEQPIYAYFNIIKNIFYSLKTILPK